MFFKNDSDRGKNAPERGIVPLLPLRDIIVFPHMVSQLFVGRERSIAALDEAMNRGKEIFLAAQRNAKTNDPTPDDIFGVGSVGAIMQLLRLPDGTVKVLIEGKRRARIRRYVQSDAYFLIEYDEIVESSVASVEVEALMRSVQSTFEMYVKLNKKIQPEVLMAVQAIDEASRLADTIIANLPTIKLTDRQALLEMEEPQKRLERLIELMQAEIEILQVEKKIRSRVKKQMEKTQKEYYLNEQMQAIQKELGGGERDEFKNEIQEIEEALKTKRMSKEAAAKVKKELKKLKMMHPTSAEATVVRNYIDWILELPWYDKSEERYDLVEAEKILDEDHYGLKKIKERILEYLAVQALTKKLKGPVLCFVGPPGVGKTSLAKSIARATGRKFVRLSLGGVRDEAEIRGHRRTYVGALPGRILQALKKAGTKNPVLVLDEVDKMGVDLRGDPAAALLEVLDPEQNSTFQDHYLDLPFDLSQVMFLATANNWDGIPGPLVDRMEVIEVPGYTRTDKLGIAREFLVPKQLSAHGLTDERLEFTEPGIASVIDHYTREAGVRGLERQIAAVCRATAVKVAEGHDVREVATPEHVEQVLGPHKHRPELAERTLQPGVATGLAWTPAGGEILFIEATKMPGKGNVVLTGNMRNVMQESASTAVSFVRSKADRLHLDPEWLKEIDLHVHIPQHGTPKDGPSAGVTMFAAVASLLLGAPVRSDVAMTGEISLRGRVMPVGGIKEKLLAAHRAGIRHVLIPAKNRRDLEDVPQDVKDQVKITMVSSMEEILPLVLEPPRRASTQSASADEIEEQAGA